MAEDSGAFKTNPRNSARIPAFVMTRALRCKDASPPETFSGMSRAFQTADFVTNADWRCGILKSA
jgi:hypothetical protein